MSAQPDSNTFPTISDWASRMDPNGVVAEVVNTLVQNNEILDDIVWQEGNLTDGHQMTRTTKMPEASTVALNQGVKPSKGEVTQGESTSHTV